tara:strand:+ start:127 stop:522 length:396 start_codon:yes stop_codon:yes gene_type:complete
LEVRELTLEDTLVNHVTELAVEFGGVTEILLGKLAKVIVPVYAGPLNDAITTPMTIVVRNSSTSLAYIGNEIRLLSNVAKNCSNSIFVVNVYVLKIRYNFLFFSGAPNTFPFTLIDLSRSQTCCFRFLRGG